MDKVVGDTGHGGEAVNVNEASAALRMGFTVSFAWPQFGHSLVRCVDAWKRPLWIKWLETRPTAARP